VRIVTMDPRKCVACGHCENACAYRRRGDFDQQHSVIRVSFYAASRVCIPLTCVHCREAWCEEICPAAAIGRNPRTGAVEIDDERCVGCRMCMLACPFGTMLFDGERGICMKCDLCGGDPACVKECVSGALSFEAEEEFHTRQRYRVDRRLAAVLDRGGRHLETESRR